MRSDVTLRRNNAGRSRNSNTWQRRAPRLFPCLELCRVRSGLMHLRRRVRREADHNWSEAKSWKQFAIGLNDREANRSVSPSQDQPVLSVFRETRSFQRPQTNLYERPELVEPRRTFSRSLRACSPRTVQMHRTLRRGAFVADVQRGARAGIAVLRFLRKRWPRLTTTWCTHSKGATRGSSTFEADMSPHSKAQRPALRGISPSWRNTLSQSSRCHVFAMRPSRT